MSESPSHASHASHASHGGDAAKHAHEASADHAGHAGHDDHAFTGEPAHELSAGESPTPAWVPVLGLVLFTAAGVYALTTGSDDASAAPAGAVSGTATAAAVAPPIAPPATAARALRPSPTDLPTRPGVASPPPLPPPGPPAAGGGTRPGQGQLSPEQIDQIRKRIQGRGAPAAVPQGH